MTRRSVPLLLSSLFGGVAGAFMASLVSFWWYPELQSDPAMFLMNLFSAGGVVSAAFVWIFYLPGLMGLLFLWRRFIPFQLKSLSYSVALMASFLLILICQMHPFAAFSNGVPEYLLNTLLAALVIFMAMKTRYGRTQPR